LAQASSLNVCGSIFSNTVIDILSYGFEVCALGSGALCSGEK